MMKRTLTIIIVTYLATTLAARAEDEKSDLDKLQGAWKVVSTEENGVAKEADGKNGFIIKGTSLLLTYEGEDKGKAKFTIDSTKQPATIDIEITNGPDRLRGKVMQGIYELEGDTLKLCLDESAKETRPKKFMTSDNDNYALAILKRVKE